MLTCTLGPLAKCSPRELVRVIVANATVWAIVGATDPGLRPLVFLTGKNAPYVLNVFDDLRELGTYPVAKYGTNYEFVHDPKGPCQIGEGKLHQTAGSLVLSRMGIGILSSILPKEGALDGSNLEAVS